jgi:methylenetetrahydrofolate reductase (NADPH)
MDSLNKVRENEAAVVDLGIDYATRQCEALLLEGAPGVHFYTLNRSHATREIFHRLSGLWGTGTPSSWR